MGSALSSLAGGAGGIGGSAAAVEAALAKIPSGPPPSAAVQQCLQSAVGKGTVAFSGAPSYVAKNVRPYNLNYIIIPAAVTYPTTAEEVAAIVKCAVDNHLGVQARSGGHSYANHPLGVKNGGSIVVDLKAFQQFSVDKSNWQATIGAGSLLGDIDQRLHSSGRAISHGTAPTIGIGGHATIGGLGPPGRMWGLTLDHVEEVEVVLANSSIVRASQHCNQDLFWAIRGAGASFGIVTEFKMRTEPEPGNAVVYSYNIEAGSTQQKANAFKAWQKLISDPKLSRRFASQFTLAEDVGAIIKGTFFGTQQEYDALNITSRLSTDPSSIQLKDWLGAMAAMVEQGVLKAIGNTSASFYSKSLPYTKHDLMSDETVDKLFSYIDSADKGGALWFFVWDLEGGAIADVPAHATAYGHRDALFFHQTYAVSLKGPLNETTRQFLRNVNQIVLDARGGRDNGAYPGYVDAELGRDSASLYWDGNAVRLQNIKGAYDPGNVFVNPQSVLPTRNVKRTITY